MSNETLATSTAPPEPRPGATPSVGLVHDYLLTMRGAERTFVEMAACWPSAPVFTLLYDPAAMGAAFAGHRVTTSALQRLRVKQGSFRYLLPLFPRAVERLPVSEFDVIVSSSSAFALGVRPGPEAVHVCYCHSPFRYVWFERERALSECPAPLRPVLRRVLDRTAAWDREAADRVTHFVANSKITQERIRAIYDRDSTIIHPPVSVDRFTRGEPEDFVLFVGQIVRHKRVDVAIEAAMLAGRPIRIVGDGPDREELEARFAGQPVEFLGPIGDEELASLYSRCLALVVANVEEFGIAAVEAQAAGRPVVAVGQGGVTETVLDGKTGILVEGESAADLAAALASEDLLRFDPAVIEANAARFSSEAFRRKLTETVAELSRPQLI
jgi:glycosyltransferase involved in cell wall biosynthesis